MDSSNHVSITVFCDHFERYMGDFDTEQNDADLRRIFDEVPDLEMVKKMLNALPDDVVEQLLEERPGKRTETTS